MNRWGAGRRVGRGWSAASRRRVITWTGADSGDRQDSTTRGSHVGPDPRPVRDWSDVPAVSTLLVGAVLTAGRRTAANLLRALRNWLPATRPTPTGYSPEHPGPVSPSGRAARLRPERVIPGGGRGRFSSTDTARPNSTGPRGGRTKPRPDSRASCCATRPTVVWRGGDARRVEPATGTGTGPRAGPGWSRSGGCSSRTRPAPTRTSTRSLPTWPLQRIANVRRPLP
jgi:hypothetical protein